MWSQTAVLHILQLVYNSHSVHLLPAVLSEFLCTAPHVPLHEMEGASSPPTSAAAVEASIVSLSKALTGGYGALLGQGTAPHYCLLKHHDFPERRGRQTDKENQHRQLSQYSGAAYSGSLEPRWLRL